MINAFLRRYNGMTLQRFERIWLRVIFSSFAITALLFAALCVVSHPFDTSHTLFRIPSWLLANILLLVPLVVMLLAIYVIKRTGTRKCQKCHDSFTPTFLEQHYCEYCWDRYFTGIGHPDIRIGSLKEIVK
jgi:hypothetical protein